MKRRQALIVVVGGFLLAGCSAFDVLSVRSQSPGEPTPEAPNTRLVGDLAVPYGMFPIRVEAVGLVTGLNGTGSDPGPSAQRDALVAEMRTRGVKTASAVLASKNTSLVMVQGVLRPGIRQGDRFDIEIRVPSRSETTSLRGGWLMETRLQELAVLDGQVRGGNLLALAQGPVMVDPAGENKDGKKDHVILGRGRVLGGGVCRKARDLGLVLKPDHQDAFNAARVANAVNRRFFSFEKGSQMGMAKAKNDKLIELAVHPRYKDNIHRYVQVVRAVALQENETQRAQRIASLQKKLLDPDTACEAALQLEAIGKQGIEALDEGLKSGSTEVRFYAAEALAYLDRHEAAEPLGQITRDEPAFRVFALTALSAMVDFTAYEQLRGLLESPSAETRYGAFRALWAMNSRDALVAGERMNGQFSYHVLDTTGPALIHVTHNKRPEVVLFGREQRFSTPLALNAGNQIMVTSSGGDEIAVAKFSPGTADQKRVVSTQVDEVIRAIVELGGAYPDVVQVFQEAKIAGALASKFEVDALPEVGRTYHRTAAAAGKSDSDDATPASPAPELFTKRAIGSSSKEGKSENEAGDKKTSEAEKPKKSGFFSGLFGKITGRGAG